MQATTNIKLQTATAQLRELQQYKNIKPENNPEDTQKAFDIMSAIHEYEKFSFIRCITEALSKYGVTASYKISTSLEQDTTYASTTVALAFANGAKLEFLLDHFFLLREESGMARRVYVINGNTDDCEVGVFRDPEANSLSEMLLELIGELVANGKFSFPSTTPVQVA